MIQSRLLVEVSSDCDTWINEGFWGNLKVIYEKTKNIDTVRRLLGHSSVTATSSYIGVTDNSALDLARIYSFLIFKIIFEISFQSEFYFYCNM